MKITRRRLLKSALAVGAGVAVASEQDREPKRVTPEELDRILDAPILALDAVKRPVKVASVELLRNGKTYLLRTRSADGVEAITVPNPDRMAVVYPVFLKTIVPVFLGRDAR